MKSNQKWRLVQGQAFNLSGLGAYLSGRRRQGLRTERRMSSCPRWSEKWLFHRVKMNTSAKSWDELYHCLHVWRGRVLSWALNWKTIFRQNSGSVLYVRTLFFYVTPQTCFVLDSCTPPSFCLLAVCRLGSRSMFALFSLVHTFPPRLFNLFKARISWTSRNAIRVFYSSRKQKLFPRARTAANGWQPKDLICF